MFLQHLCVNFSYLSMKYAIVQVFLHSHTIDCLKFKRYKLFYIF